ncbi:GTPase-activating protein GYP6 [Aspergillus candidus]|uniref:Ypt/Rab-specific GTPase-activating protein n=1 Tax=Aspergillus candidus TaxID=41067 RepID=A0A2I2EXW9_ASPCN|nr:Ypt/Rab-specific GTPase-activating protein [Aspergillus candidus]PLB33218.1 Ypt/Rab-specific GTPase-activating protein [Aspergillus candidus]
MAREKVVVGEPPRLAFLLFDNLDRSQWSRKLAESRGAYVALRDHFLKYIDHPDDLQSTVDPLADDEQSPWQTLRQDEQLRADISQDVDRCLQENFFFREPATKAKMIDILFIYSKLNPDLGYRQGMHEILAPLLWVIDRDAIDPGSVEGVEPTNELDGVLLQLLNADYVEHDSFALFCSVMQTTRLYYEHDRHRSPGGQMDVIPIVSQCHRIHDELLVTTDLELAGHLQALEVLPQIFLTRWMRLLFGREFPFQEVLVVWDRLFAEGLRSELVDFVCIAMLLRIRWELLRSDSSTVLTTLLRYPSPQPHAPQSFVHDALYLEQDPTPERGSFIIAKYSGKPPDLNKRLTLLNAKRSHLRDDLQSTSESTSPSRTPARNSPKSLEALFQDVSEGIHRRTETWGVAKAVRGAVSEAKRNMQTIQAEHRPPTTRHTSIPAMATPNEPTNEQVPQGTRELVYLQTKLDALEERNKMLAKKLSHALDDIRSSAKSSEAQEAPTDDSMKKALAEIQSVQTCLEDPTAPLERETPPATSLGSRPTKQDSTTSQPTTTESKPKGRKNGKEDSAVTPKQPQTSIKHHPKTKATEIMPRRPESRPPLAESEFSWMLGGSQQMSKFVSPVSVPPEQSRHGETKTKKNTKNSLFGNGEEEPKGAKKEPDSLAMESLRGSKGRDE